MGALYLVSDLSIEDKRTLKKYLTIEQENPGDKLLQFQKGAWARSAPTPKKIKMYEIEMMDGVEYIHLPFAFAASLFKRIPNQHIDFLKKDIRFTGSLREEPFDQKSVIKEAMEHLEKKCTTTINTPPGSGKTIMGAYLACQIKLPVIIICYQKVLRKQWQKAFEKHTNATVWVVPENVNPDKISGYNNRKNRVSSNIPDITICMDQRICKLPEVYRKSMAVVILDEAHTLCTPGKVSSLLSLEPKYIIAETATPVRSDGLYDMMKTICGTNTVIRKIKRNFTVLKVETGCVPDSSKKNKYRPGPVYTHMLNSLNEDEFRINLVLAFITDNPDFKILVLDRNVKILKELKIRLDKLGESVDTYYGSKDTYKDSRVLLGTIKKIGTGFDEENACENFSGERINMGILTTSIKDESLLAQCVGRTFRAENPTIIDLVDDHGIFSRHWKIRQKWYIDKGAEIEVVRMQEEAEPPKKEKMRDTVPDDEIDALRKHLE